MCPWGEVTNKATQYLLGLANLVIFLQVPLFDLLQQNKKVKRCLFRSTWFSSSGSSWSNRIHWLPWPSWCESKHYCNPSLVRVWISVTLIMSSIFPSLLGCWRNSRPQRGQRRKGKHLCSLFSKLTNDVILKRKSVILSQLRLLWNPASGKTPKGPSDWL